MSWRYSVTSPLQRPYMTRYSRDMPQQRCMLSTCARFAPLLLRSFQPDMPLKQYTCIYERTQTLSARPSCDAESSTDLMCSSPRATSLKGIAAVEK